MAKRKYVYYIMALLGMILVLTGFTRPVATVGRQKLVFAGNDKFAPYSYYEENNPAGFSVDLMKLLSGTIYSFASKDITIKLMPWEQCIAELKAGRVDGLIGVPIYTKREQYMTYSVPAAQIEFAIFVGTDNHYVNSIKSLEGTVVGVQKESLIVDELTANKRIQLLETTTVPEALQKLKEREVTAVVVEKDVALYYIQRMEIEDLKIVGDTVGPVYRYALAVNKSNTKLLNDINLGITTLRENGKLDELREKWFGTETLRPFPWRMVVLMSSGITVIMMILLGALWVISLNATIKTKTRQIQVMSRKMIEKDKLAVLGKLAGQIAHELRTPLSIINNSVFLLRKEGSSDRKLFERRLHMLEDKVKLTSNILESILSYSRVKAQVATSVSIKECVEEVIKDIEFPDYIERDFSFEKEELLTVFMDFHQLYSVIRNLVVNSVQAMDKKGKLTIKVFPSDDNKTINIRVCDTGRGIPEDVQNDIFTLFYTSKSTGTGLGLPISKSIVETNNGTIILEKSSAKGTCFLAQLSVSDIMVK